MNREAWFVTLGPIVTTILIWIVLMLAMNVCLSDDEPEQAPPEDDQDIQAPIKEDPAPDYSQPEQVGIWTIYRFPKRISIPTPEE